MNNAIFYNSFTFNILSFQNSHYTDARSGSLKNFIGFMRKGKAKIVSENEKLELSEGDMFFIPKGLKYQSYWEPEGVVCWESYGFDVFPDGEMRSFLLQKIEYGEKELSCLSVMANGKSTASIGTLYLLMDMLTKKMKTESGYKYIPVAEKMLRSDIRCPVESIAKACGISVSGFYMNFRKEAGMTPNDFRKKLAVEMAKELLVTTDLPIEEISRRLYFSSSSYFRKTVFAQTGKTPSQIRKNSLL